MNALLAPSLLPSRLPVTVLRPGADRLELPPTRAEFQRRIGEHWVVIDGCHPHAAARAPWWPATLWLCLRGRLQVQREEGTFALDAGSFLLTEAGATLAASTPAAREASWVALLLPCQTVSRLHRRLAGGESVDPALFAEYGRIAELASEAALAAFERALTVPPGDAAIAEFAGTVLRRLLERQRRHDDAVARASGRTLHHRRHLYARLLRVRLLVERGPQRDYAMAELARVASLSLWHFVRCFGQVFEETPHRFLTRQRLERAARLLAETDQPIAAIAEQLGFENRCAFARLFRSHFGHPASAHRRAAQGAGVTPRVAAPALSPGLGDRIGVA